MPRPRYRHGMAEFDQMSLETRLFLAIAEDSQGNPALRVFFGGTPVLERTITAAGQTGAKTINKPSGTVNFAAAATSLVVTNSLVTANSIVLCTIRTVDATMLSVVVECDAGEFTITPNAAPTGEVSVGFVVFN